MTYAQKDYSSRIGDNEHTIAEAGSLLTAIANLLTHFGYNQNPEAIASRLESLEVDPSKISWGHISLILPEVAIYSIGNGEPSYSDSIVVFNHNGRVSYAAVADVEAKTIIDSFDGEEKDWDLYGGPKIFVTFVKYPPLEVTPLVIPAAQPKTETKIESKIVEPTPTTIEEETAEHKFDLTQEDPIDHSAGIFAEESTIVPVKKISETADWKMTNKTNLGIIETVARTDAVIHDLEGEQPDIELKSGTIVNVAARFVKDGRTYYRTQGSVNNDHWYGIPAGILKKTDKQEDDELDYLLDEINMEGLSGREKIIKTAATAEGKVLGIFKRNKNTQETK